MDMIRTMAQIKGNFGFQKWQKKILDIEIGFWRIYSVTVCSYRATHFFI